MIKLLKFNYQIKNNSTLHVLIYSSENYENVFLNGSMNCEKFTILESKNKRLYNINTFLWCHIIVWIEDYFLKIYSIFFCSCVYELCPFIILGLKTFCKYFGLAGIEPPAGLFKVCFEFHNFRLTNRPR